MDDAYLIKVQLGNVEGEAMYLSSLIEPEAIVKLAAEGTIEQTLRYMGGHKVNLNSAELNRNLLKREALLIQGLNTEMEDEYSVWIDNTQAKVDELLRSYLTPKGIVREKPELSSDPREAFMQRFLLDISGGWDGKLVLKDASEATQEDSPIIHYAHMVVCAKM